MLGVVEQGLVRKAPGRGQRQAAAGHIPRVLVGRVPGAGLVQRSQRRRVQRTITEPLLIKVAPDMLSRDPEGVRDPLGI